MALLGIIRRWHIRDQVPLREIARRLGISRNTVRRYLRSEITEPAYAERQTTSAIDKYAFQLSGWLKTEAGKNRKQRRSLKQLHLDLKELGFEGSYDRVAAFARQWKVDQTDRVNSASKRTEMRFDGLVSANMHEAEKEDEDGTEYYPVTLNINYFRPSYFVLEAEPEITSFVKEFDLLVSDPQRDGMGDGEYVAQQLLSGWKNGNEFGYSAILSDEKNRSEVYHLPTAQLRNAWKWNLSRSELQAQVGESKFVPRVMFMNIDGITVTAVVWPDAIPIVTTSVDFLCVPRKELAPKKFFRKQEDTIFVKWEAVLPIFQKYGTKDADGIFNLSYLTPPTDVAKFVQSLPKVSRTVVGISSDKVLDREIVEKNYA